MRITQGRLPKLISPRVNSLMILTSLLSVLGTAVMLSGGVWDATSHILNEPEFFWTIQHVAVYTGLGITTVAGFLGYLVYRTARLERFSLGVKILMAGTVLQIVSGFGDSVSHDVFGIDGLVSLSHQPLELGLVLVSLSGLMILKNIQGSNNTARKIVPFSALSFIVAASWLAFNLLLPVGGILMCLPIYEIFSSGCAVM